MYGPVSFSGCPPPLLHSGSSRQFGSTKGKSLFAATKDPFETMPEKYLLNEIHAIHVGGGGGGAKS